MTHLLKILSLVVLASFATIQSHAACCDGTCDGKDKKKDKTEQKDK